ncbi:MAG: lactate utilization protein [Candidatus Doudnabacteria bacterium]
MYDEIATDEAINKTIAALKEHGVEAEAVNTGADALSKIKQLIPAGVSVMNGGSVTLDQIGFIEYLKSTEQPWNNLHAKILAEPDQEKQAVLRKQTALSDYYLGSVHALSETGEFLVASNTGSQLPHIVFTSPNLIFVVGAQKIVPTMTEAMRRLEEYVVPLEDARLMKVHNAHTMLSKVVLFLRENTRMGRKVHLIIVKEILGF